MSSRNIVILSDGTGNSSNAITKSNIWRIFQALDLDDGKQLAFYDDGVGTSGSIFFRALGGAMGFGLARNVMQLYEELCRHYTGKDDKIFLFGFSRGAFTVRVLSGLIGHCGIIDRSANNTVKVWRWSKFRTVEIPVSSDEGLRAAVRMAYRSMRMRNDHAVFSHIVSIVRDRVFTYTPKTEIFRKNYSVSPRPKIEFLGVFDTVSAYGLPNDEMAIAVHKYLFPLRYPNNILSKKVTHAYQALALDEARHSFHPVLWTERKFAPKKEQGDIDDRPKQVWFSGVHADIGGGYGNERLSLVSAVWMIERACNLSGLIVHPAMLSNLKSRASALGEIHDSRRGMGSFYRFKPRILESLGKEDMDGNNRVEVEVERFKIHETVFERIIKTGGDYAPVGIPEDYDVVSTTIGRTGKETLKIQSADQAGYETAKQREQRIAIQGGIRDTIFHRQIAQYIMLSVALIMISVPFLWLPNPSMIHDGWAAKLVGLIALPITFLPIPGGDRIGEYWAEHPYWAFGLVAVFIATYVTANGLKDAMQSKAQKAWVHLSGGKLAEEQPKPQWIDSWRKATAGFHRIWTKKTLPLILVVLLFAALPAIIAFRWYIFYDYGFGSVCTTVAAKNDVGKKRPVDLKRDLFSTEDKCFDTGYQIAENHRYIIKITPQIAWKDDKIPASPLGLDWSKMTVRQKIIMRISSISRRFWNEDWFAPMGSIGRSRDHTFRIEAVQSADKAGTYVYSFQAWRSGTLYLFVNDALLPGFDFYTNNKGNAKIEINPNGEN